MPGTVINIPNELVHDELNDTVWSGWRLRPKVREHLLKVAEAFRQHLTVVERDMVEDVLFTGSLANFNYTDQSDIDLHLLIDFSAVDDEVTLVSELLMAKKGTWNDVHDIRINDHPVECYPQDVSEPHVASGVYSVMRDEWIKRPAPEKPTVDKRQVKRKADELKRMIDDALGDNSTSLDRVKKKIKALRQAGLEKGGEFSVENLAFKVLRNSGYMEKLVDAHTDAVDSQLSLDQEL